MAIKSIACLTDKRASVSHFVKLRMDGGKWGITCDDSLVSGGNPRYTLSVCSFNGKESQFRELSSETSSMLLTGKASGENFKFAYLGLSYIPAHATGEVQFYLNT